MDANAFGRNGLGSYRGRVPETPRVLLITGRSS